MPASKAHQSVACPNFKRFTRVYENSRCIGQLTPQFMRRQPSNCLLCLSLVTDRSAPRLSSDRHEILQCSLPTSCTLTSDEQLTHLR
jgi:hypothetical protein